MLSWIEDILLRFPTYGYRRVTAQLQREGHAINHKEVTRPDQVWCAGITYIQWRQGFVYLAIILDLFTRGLRGRNLARTLSTELALTALERALARRLPEIHHSDQGLQYAARGYTVMSHHPATQAEDLSPSYRLSVEYLFIPQVDFWEFVCYRADVTDGPFKLRQRDMMGLMSHPTFARARRRVR